MTYNADKCVKPIELVPEDDKPIAIVVGAIAIGSVRLYALYLFCCLSGSTTDMCSSDIDVLLY